MLRTYLEDTRLTIQTDHDLLQWIMNLTDATGRLVRWRLRLSKFDCDPVHRAGAKHQNADALPHL